MKRIYLSLLVGILLIGGIIAGGVLTKDKELPKEDKVLLEKYGVTGYTINIQRDEATLKPISVCISWSATFSTMCFTPIPYTNVCKEEQPKNLTEEWKCPEYIKVQKTKEQLESDVKAFEDESLNRILTRARTNEAKAEEDKETKAVISEAVDVAIKEAK